METKLWGYRFTPVRDWAWVLERDCSTGNASEWLRVFRNDEPDVTFLISRKKPTKSWKGSVAKAA